MGLCKNSNRGGGVVGHTVALEILETISDIQKESTDNINTKPYLPMVSTENNIDLAAIEVENWKAKQKQQFQGQLQKLEQHHINTLSDEWNKR